MADRFRDYYIAQAAFSSPPQSAMSDPDRKGLVFLGDEVQEDQPVIEESPAEDNNDTEYEDDGAIAATQKKRKRATNNSFALDLENGANEEVIMPPPVKRFHFNQNQEKGVLIGVWKLSPEPLDSRKHAVYAFIDAASKLRSRIWPERKTGEELMDGYPSRPGQSMVAPNNIIFEYHIAHLTRPQIKEYVRIRSQAPNNEPPEQRRLAEERAVNDAIENVGSEDALTDKRSMISPLRGTKSSVLNSQKKPKGILLGYWRDSWLNDDYDKHAVFGVLQDDERLRVRVVKETRDGRPLDEPMANSVWIPYEQIVLEPHLANLARVEVREYVRFRQLDLLEDKPDFDQKAAEEDAVQKAKAKVLASAQAVGFSNVLQYDASVNASRIAKNVANAALKEIDSSSNQTRFTPPTSKSKVELSLPDAHSDSTSPLDRTRDLEIENRIEHKAKAVRSSKAASNARAERTRKEREREFKETGFKRHKLRNGASEDIWDGFPTDKFNVEPTKVKSRRDEHHMNDSMRDSARYDIRGEDRHKVKDYRRQRVSDSNSVGARDDIKNHNGITYERKQTGPFKDKLVGDKRELLMIDGEDYIEYRVIMKVQF